MTTKPNAISRARNSVQRALDALEEELARHQAGHGQVSSPEQITAFREALLRMRDDIHCERKGLVQVGMGRVIADSWPFDSELGDIVVRAEQDYRGIRG